MKKSLSAIALFLLGSLLNYSSFAGEIPIVSKAQFKEGNFWTWTYYTNGDFSQPYSSERYSVVFVEGEKVTIEIASRPKELGEFIPRVRFRTKLSQCEKAFRNPDLKMNFSVELYPLTDGAWPKTPIVSPATAFEEKFNCNPVLHHRSNAMYTTQFETVETPYGLSELFQQLPKYSKSQLLAYYFLDHRSLSGVAYKKAFNPGTVGYYEMRLTDWGVL